MYLLWNFLIYKNWSNCRIDLIVELIVQLVLNARSKEKNNNPLFNDYLSSRLISKPYKEQSTSINFSDVLSAFLKSLPSTTLSRGLNLSRGSNMVCSNSNCIQCFKIWVGVQLKPVFGGFKTRLKFIKFGLWPPKLNYELFLFANPYLHLSDAPSHSLINKLPSFFYS